MGKMVYESPEVEINLFETEDIIQTSSGLDNNLAFSEWENS